MAFIIQFDAGASCMMPILYELKNIIKYWFIDFKYLECL